MRRSLILGSIFLLWAGTAFGGFVGYSCNDSDSVDSGSHDFGFHEHGFWGGGPHGFGWGLGPWRGWCGSGSVEGEQRRADRIENRYDALVAKYDAGVADNPDFVGSDAYHHLLKSFQRLEDRDQSFLDRDTDLIHCIGDLIDRTNERIQHYADLLANPPDTIPADCLDKFTERITAKQDRLETRVDDLTTKQTTLQENHDAYVTFHDELVAYLDQITAAGQSTGSGTEDLLDSVSLTDNAATDDGLLATSGFVVAVTDDQLLRYAPAQYVTLRSPTPWVVVPESVVSEESIAAAVSVPEPSTVLLAVFGVLAALGFAGYRRLTAG